MLSSEITGMRSVKILLIILAAISFIVIIAVLSLPKYLESKITGYVNESTPYELSIGTISIGLSSVVIRDIVLKPKLDKEAFYRENAFETDWIKAGVNVVRLQGIDWKELLLNNRLELNHASIAQADIYVFRDKRLPNKGTYKPMPQAVLRDAGFPFSVPELRLADSRVVYEEITEKTNASLAVPFGNLEAVLRHISSDERYLEKNPEMTIEAQARIFDSVHTTIRYAASTPDSSNTFTLKGHTGAFRAGLLNRISDATKVNIESGYISGIDFSFKADEHRSSGTMNMNYRDLKVKVAEQEKLSRLKSLLANALIRNDDKKQVSGTFTGEIAFERRKDRFIFNYWWNSFKSGIISSVVKPAK